MARVFLKPGGIANWIKEQAITLGQLRIFFQRRHEPCQRQRAFRFVAMDGRKDADADDVAAPLGSEIDIARHRVFPSAALESPERLPEQMLRLLGYLVQLRQQPV